MLGLLSFPGKRTGHELKKWAHASLRFFHWSPAFSQIYAELRRLEALGHATAPRAPEVEPAEALLDDLEHLAHAARTASEPPGQRVADSPTCG
ncbi:hypothetical protein ACGF5Q_23710 [Streptomyces huasconensis]